MKATQGIHGTGFGCAARVALPIALRSAVLGGGKCAALCSLHHPDPAGQRAKPVHQHPGALCLGA
jgi:hypothetical protein